MTTTMRDWLFDWLKRLALSFVVGLTVVVAIVVPLGLVVWLYQWSNTAGIVVVAVALITLLGATLTDDD